MWCFFFTVHKIKYISLSSWLSNPGRNQSSHISRSHVHHNPSIWLRDKNDWKMRLVVTVPHHSSALVGSGSGSVLSVGGWNSHWFQMEYGRISIISGDTRELGMSICVVLSDMKDLWQLIMTSMQDHLLQDSKSFRQQQNSHYAKRQRWHQRCHLWGVLKKSQDWHTRCWRHCCERRTCWWKDGSEPAMVWCDERLPGAALPSPRP